MSENKQIEEMAKLLCLLDKDSCNDCKMKDYCLMRNCAECFYKYGYRKQSEGEWIKKYDKAPRYVCSVCNHLFNNKEYKFCPFCGAKMKGENDE